MLVVVGSAADDEAPVQDFAPSVSVPETVHDLLQLGKGGDISRFVASVDLSVDEALSQVCLSLSVFASFGLSLSLGLSLYVCLYFCLSLSLSLCFCVCVSVVR